MRTACTACTALQRDDLPDRVADRVLQKLAAEVPEVFGRLQPGDASEMRKLEAELRAGKDVLEAGYIAQVRGACVVCSDG